MNQEDLVQLRTLYESQTSRKDILTYFVGQHWERLRKIARKKEWKRGKYPENWGPFSIETKQEPVKLLAKPINEVPITVNEQVKYDRQLSSLQAENRLLKEKYKLLLKESNAQDTIISYAKTSIDSLPAITPSVVPIFNKKSNKTVETLVLAMACLHLGEEINLNEMAGLNSFNFDIACKRIQNLIDRTIKFTTQNMSAHSFEAIHVFLLGDFVSGVIHKELETSNGLNIVEQVQLGALVMSQALIDLSREFPQVEVTCVVGNHGRTGHEKYYKNKAQVNWDFVAYNTMALLLKNYKNIKFNIPLSFFAGVQIYDWKFLLQHGDGVKSWNGIPFYGLMRDAGKWREIYAAKEDFFHYMVSAHFHTRASLQTSNGEMVLVGSLKGCDEYALGLHLFNKPSQTLFGVHKDHGKTWCLNIDASVGQDNVDLRYKYNRSKVLADQIELL